MNPTAIVQLILALFAAIRPSRRAIGYTTAASKIRAALAGSADPWGTGNSKTGCPSTYRPTGQGGTCSASCPLFQRGACYARKGHCAMAAERATGTVDRSLTAAIAALVLGAKYGRIVRLHTSGDALAVGTGVLDQEYLRGLGYAIRYIRLLGYQVTVGTYTHLQGANLEAYQEWAQSVGVTLWTSDRWTAGGAVCVPKGTNVKECRKRNPKLHLVACPAQHSDVQCNRCRACYNPALHRTATILFLQH